LIKIAQIVQNTRLSLALNLNSWLNNNGFKSTYYHGQVKSNNKNFIYLDTPKILNKIIRKIYLKYKKLGIANFSFYRNGIGNSNISKIINSSDIVHIHWINNFLSLDNIKYLSLNKPIVITVHDYHLLYGGCHYLEGCKNYLDDCKNCPQISGSINDIAHVNFLQKKNIFQSKQIYFVHQNNNSYIEGKKIYPKNHHEVIDCTVDIDLFYPLQNINELKKKFKIPSNKKILLSLCSYNCNSKQVESYNILKKNLDSNTFLILVGEGFSSFSNIKNQVLNLGHIESKFILNQLYNISDIVFTLSNEETVPGIACEALSSGTPFVAYKAVGNVEKMILDDFNGFKIKNKSVKDYALNLNKLHFLTKKEDIRKDYIERFHSSFYEKYEKLYKKINQNFLSKNSDKKEIENSNNIEIKAKNFDKILDNYLTEELDYYENMQKPIIKRSIYIVVNFKYFLKQKLLELLLFLKSNLLFNYLWKRIFGNRIKNLLKKLSNKI
jgi:hypothetical protein